MRYTIDPAIMDLLAAEFAATRHSAYSSAIQGEVYAVDTDGDGVLDTVSRAETHRPWNPWHDNAVAVSADACFDEDAQSMTWGEDADADVEGEEAVRFARLSLRETVEYDPEVDAWS